MEAATFPPKVPFWLAVKRALREKCPNCGKGRLFRKYLKQVDRCAMCNESFEHIHADDGPAWLTIVLVGHILAPALLIVIPNSTWSDTTSMIVWPAAALALTLFLLPRSKALFIAMIWRTQSQGAST